MNEPTSRPRVSIRFRYNADTGAIEEFLIDDHAPDRTEQYHDRIAGAIASHLARNSGIADAGNASAQIEGPPRTTETPLPRERDQESAAG